VKKILIGMIAVLFISASFIALSSDAGAAEYIGAKKCKACHIKQYKSWEKTSMAQSFENLKPGVKADAKKKAGLDPDKDYTGDAGCLKCHTTGYGKPGGFTTIDATPDLAGVQCESCHGPGSEYRDTMKKNKEYKLAEVKAQGLIIPSEDEAGCMACHGEGNPFKDRGFNFKEALEKTHEHFPLKKEH
jgi:hypothetical protein